ncbi:uncharacterized protein LOC127242643 [Andrographis paniculata]|uniref:uncharacterized protein LOC127242643 n=1 Tax=Andrographis paniculata TaxID=175694 RepID=UPI0021E75B5E|nr:uncharacterized protein LOC127242643 [Andrographis paniculata]
MGKAPTAAATPEMKRKKKGRPSKNPSPVSTPPNSSVSNSTSRRSTRRNPNNFNSPPQSDFEDDEDERKEKKVKLVVRLPQSDEKSKTGEKNQLQRHSRGSDSDSGSESEDRDGPMKKRKINGVDDRSDDGELDQDKKPVIATDIPPKGSPLESGPTIPLPDKKLLVFILDRLQKKDTYGVFSEPVDLGELPDYLEIIENPMDFGTVREKLETGAYKNLEELESDVLLICSNAMQYNASDTVYYRQARAIQDLAKRDFENLKHQGDNGELQPRVVRRGRPPNSKNQKKSAETSPGDRVESSATEVSTGVSLANGEDKPAGSNSYNLRKSPGLYKFKSTDPFVSNNRPRNGVSEWLADWNDEFPASILRADMKHTKRQFTVDENRRDTYKQSLSLSNNLPVFYNSLGSIKRLAPVGFQEALAYARSLARYAANLGPVAWKLASKKIETVLPAGVEYGHGWVGDKQAPSQLFSHPTDKQKAVNSVSVDCNSGKHISPQDSDASPTVASGLSAEAVKKLNSQNELSRRGNTAIHQSYRNGFTGALGYDVSAAALAREATPGNSMTDSQMMGSTSRSHMPEQVKLSESGNNVPQGHLNVKTEASDLHVKTEASDTIMEAEVKPQQAFAEQQRHSLSRSVPPDLNTIVPTGSPSSSLQISSPRQPDLALQL